MDGKNRTAIIDVGTKSDHDIILSFTLDYHAQVIYWIFSNNDSHRLNIKCLNTDRKIQQIIYLRLHYTHYYNRYSSGLTIFNETLFLSLSRMSELYKIGINGDMLPLINSSAQVFCRFWNYQLKATNQPQVSSRVHF